MRRPGPLTTGKTWNRGNIVEIIREALKRVGYELETVWLPWKRAQVEAARGGYDGLGASYYSEERANKFAYSDPIATTEVVFFKRTEDDIKYSKLEDLKPYKIGTGFGYGYPEKFVKADYLLTPPLRNNWHQFHEKKSTFCGSHRLRKSEAYYMKLESAFYQDYFAY